MHGSALTVLQFNLYAPSCMWATCALWDVYMLDCLMHTTGINVRYSFRVLGMFLLNVLRWRYWNKMVRRETRWWFLYHSLAFSLLSFQLSIVASPGKKRNLIRSSLYRRRTRATISPLKWPPPSQTTCALGAAKSSTTVPGSTPYLAPPTRRARRLRQRTKQRHWQLSVERDQWAVQAAAEEEEEEEQAARGAATPLLYSPPR